MYALVVSTPESTIAMSVARPARSSSGCQSMRRLRREMRRIGGSLGRSRCVSLPAAGEIFLMPGVTDWIRANGWRQRSHRQFIESSRSGSHTRDRCGGDDRWDGAPAWLLATARGRSPREPNAAGMLASGDTNPSIGASSTIAHPGCWPRRRASLSSGSGRSSFPIPRPDSGCPRVMLSPAVEGGSHEPFPRHSGR